jgi:ubiquinone/menaquinone biosynthesis C-methylase UbiE
MRSRFTEHDTEAFYDAEDALYRSFWDSEGSLHWGWFDSQTGDDFLKACANLNRTMAEKAKIQVESQVLDLGCGNGTTATWLAVTTGCRVTGIDLSGVRIGNAMESLKNQPAELRKRLGFKKASASALPFDEGAFSHVWSQATIYHVHQKERALTEVFRVLEPGGIFIFDDLTKPREDISAAAQAHVYDRLLFDTDFSFSSYQKALGKVGFQVVEAHDLSTHLRKSYQCLSSIAKAKSQYEADKFQSLASAYDHMVQAVDHGELGWGMYLCQK